MQDQTTVRQSMSGPSIRYEFKRDFRVPFFMTVDVETMTGDQRLNVYRFTAGSEFKPFRPIPLALKYGLSHYFQEVKTPNADPSDEGGQLYIATEYRANPWLQLGLTYYSDDIEGTDPDDPGDYIELQRLEYSVFVSPPDTNISVGITYAEVGSNCSYGMLMLRWRR